jgi:hypothetical protein
MRLAINLIFILLLFNFVNQTLNKVLPAYKNFLNSSESKNQKENELLKVRELNKKFEFLQKDIIKKIYEKKQSGYLDDYLPDNFVDYEFTIFLNALLSSNQFPQPHIQNFSQEIINHPNYKNIKFKKISFSINHTGSFSEILRLINVFQSSSRIFEIEKLTMSKNNGNINANLLISTYYFEK